MRDRSVHNPDRVADSTTHFGWLHPGSALLQQTRLERSQESQGRGFFRIFSYEKLAFLRDFISI